MEVGLKDSRCQKIIRISEGEAESEVTGTEASTKEWERYEEADY